MRRSRTTNFTDRKAAIWRACAGGVVYPLFAMFALVTQLFVSVPAFATNGTMIEICSEYGSVFLEVDLSGAEDTDTDGCPDCRDCAFCAPALTGLDSGHVTHQLQSMSVTRLKGLTHQTDGPVQNCTWPQTRGPPAASTEITDRAPCAIMANFLSNGGAL